VQAPQRVQQPALPPWFFVFSVGKFFEQLMNRAALHRQVIDTSDKGATLSSITLNEDVKDI